MRIPDSLGARLEIIFGIDLRTLALFRVPLGGVLFVDLVLRAADLQVFYTDTGVMPRDLLVAVNGLWRISLHTANGETWFIALLFAAEMIAALMILLGWRTRLATILAFVLHASLLNRNPLVLIGGDALIVCLLFWAAFLPLAARASVDAALSDAVPANTQHLSWASAGLLLQVMSVSFFAALRATGGDGWLDGAALDRALRVESYVTPLGHWLRGFPQATGTLAGLIYFAGLIGPLLAFSPVLHRPLRFIVMLLLMAIQLGFLFCFALGPEPFFNLAALTVLAGGWLWDAAARAGQRRAARRGALPLRIYFERDCGFCLKSVRLLKSLLILPRAEISAAQDTPRAKALLEANGSWVIIDHDDHAYLKWPAFDLLLRRSPVFAPLGWLLSGAWAVRPGNAVYDFVARKRGAFGAASAWLLPFHEHPFMTGAKAQGIAGFALFVLLVSNLASIGWLPNEINSVLTPPLRILRLDQDWRMPAPFVARDNGWFVIPGQLLDGTEIDLMHPRRGAVSYDKPLSVAAESPDVRWRQYMARLRPAEGAPSRPRFGQYLCRRWNAEHDDGQQLVSLKVVDMLERPASPGALSTLEQTVLSRQDCLGAPAPNSH